MMWPDVRLSKDARMIFVVVILYLIKYELITPSEAQAFIRILTQLISPGELSVPWCTINVFSYAD